MAAMGVKKPASAKAGRSGGHLPSLAESSTLEYKRELPKRDVLLATLCALANTAGGELHIGVDDSGQPVGLGEESILACEETISSWIAQGIKPLLLPLIRIKNTAQGPVLVVQVGLGSNRPFARVGREGETVFVRIGSTTRQADTATVERLRLQSTGRTWDTLPASGVREKDIDMDLVREFWKSRNQARGIPMPKGAEREWLLKHRFLTNETGRHQPTHAGVLFFHQHPEEVLPQARVELARFAKADTRDFLDKRTLSGPLWKLPIQAADFLAKHLPLRATRFGKASRSSLQRIETLSYPETAFREFFLNALCHRTYEGPGTSIHVALFDDVLEITNPGSLPEGLEIQDLGAGISMLRNPILAKGFNEIGLIEGWGTGIQVAQQFLRDAMLPPAQFHLKGFFFQVTSVWRWSSALDEAEQNLLNQAAQSGSLNSAEAASRLGLSERSARRILVSLAEKGYLLKSGSTRAASYKLK